MTLPKEYLSYSQISMYLRCGQQYKFRYIEDKIIPPSIALLKGGAVHEGVFRNNVQKIDSRQDLKKADIVEHSVTALEEKTLNQEIKLTEEEKTEGKDKVLGKCKDSVVTLTELYADDMSPKIQPVMAEHNFDLTLPDIPPIKTIIDCIDDKGIVRDTKTAGRKKSQNDVDKSLQLTLYSIAYMEMFKELPSGVCFDVLVEKKQPEYQEISTDRTLEHFQPAIDIVDSVVKGIGAGVFLPAAEGSWICSKKFCGYYDICKYV